MSPAWRGSQPRLERELGLFDVYAISTGAMFSSGFFLLPGLAAAMTGPSVPLAYLVAGILILPAMLSVAELATAMPRAGGAYYFLDRAFGPVFGSVGGLGTWLALVLKSAFALVGMGAYLAIYTDIAIKPLAVGLTVLFMVVNLVGAKETTGLQRVLVATLLAVLGFFLIQGLAALLPGGVGELRGDRFSPFFAYGLTGFAGTVGFVFVSYAGLTKVASVAEEIRDPDRNIPLGMVLSLVTATFVYTVGVFIIVAVLPPEALREDLTPVATAAQSFFGWLPGGTGVALIVVAAVAAFASTGNAGILSASRYPLAMARDRVVPARFGQIGRFGTPSFAIVTTAGAMVVFILVLDIASIAKLASAFQLLLFSLLNLAVVVMRESQIDAYDPGYRSPFYPWMQIFGFLSSFWLISQMGQMAILFTLALVFFTLVWYFVYVRDRVEREGAIFHTFARLGAMRYDDLDLELRSIVREKGLRAEDPYDEVISRASVVNFTAAVTPEVLVFTAAERLSKVTGLDAGLLRTEFEAGLQDGNLPVAHGAALPHLRFPDIDTPQMLLVRCPVGVEAPGRAGVSSEAWSSVRAIVFLVSPADAPGQHLRLLGHLATHVDDPAFMDRWLAARDDSEMRATLLQEDRWATITLVEGGLGADWIGSRVRDLDLGDVTLLVFVRRGGEGIVPHGDTVLMVGDRVTLIGDPEGLAPYHQPNPGSGLS